MNMYVCIQYKACDIFNFIIYEHKMAAILLNTFYSSNILENPID